MTTENQSPPQIIYPIRYTVQFGKFTKDDVTKKQQGLTHNMIIISCIPLPDGGYSQTWVSFDGIEQKEMSTNDVFKAWILMAESLLRKEDLPEGRRLFLKETWEIFKAITFGRPIIDRSAH